MKEHSKRKDARAMLLRMGYKSGGHVKAHGDKAEDEAMIKKEVKPAALKKLKDGGCADGGAARPRADRLKRGGRAKHKKGAHVQVNVINAAHQQPKPVPVPIPVPAGAGAGGPPPPGMPPGGPPMPHDPNAGAGGPMGLKRGGRAKKMKIDNQRDSKAGMPMGHFKKGGRTGYPIDDGAGGGLGRMEKAKAYGA